MRIAQRRHYGALAADSYGTDDSRPPLVLLHGLSYDRRQWEPLLAELAVLDPGRRVVSFDLPGHGNSPRLPSYRSAEVAAVIHRAVSEAGLGAPVLVGHSLGGALATTYAGTYPAAAVVNVDQPLLAGPFAQMLRSAEAELRGPGWEAVWDSLLTGMRIDLLAPEARELVRTATEPRQDLLLGYWSELLDTPAEELGERRARELDTIRARGTGYHHIAGGDVPPAYQEWLESRLPDVTVTVLAGGGHFPHVARPAELARILTG
ncbi:alpha/beta hydrolase [Streptomyces sp. NBC_01476]|uniref:alpha/beta fold hydrolase n=1 Tax=Streptomyces sp. NBC_01476 TaxID=2903881 RepID=UPI002E2F925F|nr:alpha/beta fold hydrolase [Streptomyces sp. NBC_01476]